MDKDYYLKLFQKEKKLKLTNIERIKYVLEKIEYKKSSYIIHVAGTNGKGSTVSFLKSILLQSNYSVSTFISPFVTEFNERITYDFENISNIDFVNCCEILLSKVDIELTYFEYLFVVFLIYITKMKPDFLIVETGIGGLNDCTNAIDTDLQLVTNASLDHTELLGETEQDILIQKLGIFKTHLITTDIHTEDIKEYFSDSSNYTLVSNIKKLDEDHAFEYENKQYKVSLNGDYQFKNASLVIEACKYINKNTKYLIKEDNIKEGLLKAFWPGRYEIFGNITIDGAHNIDGLKSILNNYKYRDNIVICQMKDKLSPEISSLLKNAGFKKYYVYLMNYERAITEKEADENYDFPFELIKSLDELDLTETILCIGSLYFISEIRNFLSKKL